MVKMTLKRAKEITGHRSGLGKPSKMPGFSTSLPAQACKNGRKLAEKSKNSVCSDCYAMTGNYQYPDVKKGLGRRLEALKIAANGIIGNTLWVDAMVRLIGHYTDKSDPFFRIHDSGDIQSVDHLRAWIAVARALPWVRFWMPTKEYLFYRQARKKWDIPENLVIRLSAPLKGQKRPATYDRWGALSSTVQSGDGFECGAYKRGNRCGPCRACWDSSVENVDYHIQ